MICLVGEEKQLVSQGFPIDKQSYRKVWEIFAEHCGTINLRCTPSTKQLCTKTKFHEYRIKDICSFALADFCIHLKPLQSRKLPRSQSTTKIPNIFLNSIKLKNLICKNKSISRQISNEHFEPSHPPILASILLISTVINFWSSFWQTNSFPRWSWVSANLDWAPKIHCLNP